MAVKPVFIGGSIAITELAGVVMEKLDNIVGLKIPVLVGDAPGIDAAVQAYLAGKEYKDVVVYHSGRPRNNLGSWNEALYPGRHVKKDEAMAKDCRYGLMIWDGKSRGTKANILRLAAAGKPCAVYIPLKREVRTVRSPLDLWMVGIGDNPF